MPNASTSFFGWVAFLLEKYGMLFLRGTGMTLLIALTGTALGFALGLLVAIIRTIALPEKKKTGSNVGVTLRRGLLRRGRWRRRRGDLGLLGGFARGLDLLFRLGFRRRSGLIAHRPLSSRLRIPLERKRPRSSARRDSGIRPRRK